MIVEYLYFILDGINDITTTNFEIIQENYVDSIIEVYGFDEKHIIDELEYIARDNTRFDMRYNNKTEYYKVKIKLFDNERKILYLDIIGRHNDLEGMNLAEYFRNKKINKLINELL